MTADVKIQDGMLDVVLFGIEGLESSRRLVEKNSRFGGDVCFAREPAFSST